MEERRRDLERSLVSLTERAEAIAAGRGVAPRITRPGARSDQRRRRH